MDKQPSKLDQLRALREAKTSPVRGARAKTATAESQGDSIARTAGATPATGAISRRTGRPRIEDRDKTIAAQRPWEKLGMSRTTWFRRQAERKGRD